MRGIVLGLALMAPGAAVCAEPSLLFSKPADRWSGLYAGVVMGASWSEISGFGYDIYLEPYGERSSLGGFTAGAKIGYSRQIGDLVVGVEADLQFLKAETFTDYTAPWLSQAVFDKYSASPNWLSTARMRVGVITSPFLLVYATGGFALSEVRFSEALSVYDARLLSLGLMPWSESKTRFTVGWTVGLGMEFMLGERWSAVVEALYVDMGTVSFEQSDSKGVVYDTPSGEVAMGIARAGINYRF